MDELKELSGWMSVAQASRRLGVTPRWIRVLVENKQLHTFRTPLGLLVAEHEVEQLAAQRGERPKRGRACGIAERPNVMA